MTKPTTASLRAGITWAEITADVATKQETTKRFSMIPAYSGGLLDLPDWKHPVVVDLRGLDCGDQERPILMRHQKGEADVVGHSHTIVNDGRTVSVTGVIHATSDAGRAVIARAQVDYPWEASVGLLNEKSRFIEAGETIEVNGQRFTGPLELIEKARLREVSIVVLGADAKTAVTIEAQGKEGGRSAPSTSNPRGVNADATGVRIVNFEDWVKSLGLDVATLSEAQTSELRKAFDAMQAATAEETLAGEGGGEKPKEGEGNQSKETTASAGNNNRTVEASGDATARFRRQHADEIERVAAISTICGGNRVIEAQAVRENWTLDQTRLRILEAQAPTWASSRGTGDGAWENRSQVLEAAICNIAGVRSESMQRMFQPRVLEAADRSDVRGVTLGQLFGEFTNANGGHIRPGRLHRDDLHHVSAVNRRYIEAAGTSTISVTGVLSNAANKILLDAFNSVESVIPLITAALSTPDFKEFKAYRLTGKGQLAEVGADGELKSVSLQEEEYANRVKIHGAILTLTEVMLTNDDLGAFTSAASVLGRMAMDDLLLAVAILKLANTNNFYHADNGNLLTGAGSVLATAGMSDAVAAFLNQKDANGRSILAAPKQIVVPAKLKEPGDRLYIGNTLNETTTANKPSVNANTHVGLYKVITFPYLGTNFNAINGGNGSDTKWWLESAPTPGAAPINVAYLNGQKTPRIEDSPAPFNVLGHQYRVVFPWGVGFGDKRTSVQNNGA